MSKTNQHTSLAFSVVFSSAWNSPQFHFKTTRLQQLSIKQENLSSASETRRPEEPGEQDEAESESKNSSEDESEVAMRIKDNARAVMETTD